jgi:putative membrane protein
MRTTLTLALAASAVLAASSGALAQSQDTKEPSTRSEPKKSSLDRADRRHFREIAQANMAEVEAGKLAQGKASSDEVKKFAQHMVEDHSRMLEEQETMAQSKAVSLPKAPAKAEKSALKKLQSESGAQFDRSYMQQMVKGHEKALKLVQDTANSAKDPQLKQAAEKAAPEVQQHLDMAKQIAAKQSG